MSFVRFSLLALILGGASISLAQSEPTPAAKKDTEGFEPVTDAELGKGEVMPASRLVAGAYGFILAALVVWTVSVAVRSSKVSADLEALRKKIEK